MNCSNLSRYALSVCAAAILIAGCDGHPSGISPMQTLNVANPTNFSPEQILYRFLGGADGSNPFDGLLDVAGDFYGTTRGGEPGGFGTVFKLTPSLVGYAETVLYAFRGGSADGSGPLGGLIADKTGAFYGLTYGGGSGYYGTAFKLTPSGGGYSESIIYFFHGTDGSNPNGTLISDASGRLYGTTTAGGADGFGTVFRLAPSGTGYSEAVLYSFKGGSDGATPRAQLLAAGSNLFYGTTLNGGGTSCNSSATAGCGTVFRLKLTASGATESIVYRFQAGSDGANPYGDLIADSKGGIYGTTGRGGNQGSACGTEGCGAVFRLTPARKRRFTESIIYRFKGGGDGLGPVAGLVASANGTFYGTTLLGGGAANAGTVFALTPVKSGGYTERVLYRFGANQADGASPSADLIFGGGNALYSTTSSGGTSSHGTVFSIVP